MEEGRKWVELEMHTYAIERDVSLTGISWTETQSSSFIVELKSKAGEHTISIPYDQLERCASDTHVQFQLRDRLRGLIGDLARIEKRGHLR